MHRAYPQLLRLHLRRRRCQAHRPPQRKSALNLPKHISKTAIWLPAQPMARKRPRTVITPLPSKPMLAPPPTEIVLPQPDSTPEVALDRTAAGSTVTFSTSSFVNEGTVRAAESPAPANSMPTAGPRNEAEVNLAYADSDTSIGRLDLSGNNRVVANENDQSHGTHVAGVVTLNETSRGWLVMVFGGGRGGLGGGGGGGLRWRTRRGGGYVCSEIWQRWRRWRHGGQKNSGAAVGVVNAFSGAGG